MLRPGLMFALLLGPPVLAQDTPVQTVFTAVHELSGGGGGVATTACDVDADGALDIVVVGSFDARVTIAFNDGTGHFDSGTDFPVIAQGWQPGLADISFADFDLNGLPDFVVTPSSTTTTTGQLVGQFEVVLNTGAGGFVSAGLLFFSGTTPRYSATGDLNLDGLADIAVLGSPYGLSTYLGDGSGGFSGPISAPFASTSGDALTIADMDGDGLPDVVAAFGSLSRIYWGDGTGNFSEMTIMAGGGDIDVGDFDADGLLDIVCSGGTNGASSLKILRGLGSRSFASPSTMGLSWPSPQNQWVACWSWATGQPMAYPTSVCPGSTRILTSACQF